VDDLREALEHPLDFPPLEQALIPDDHVALALDRNTPEAAALVAATWRVLEQRQIRPENVTIIQPAVLNGRPQRDPRNELPQRIRERVGWTIHEPTDQTGCRYLASTAAGDRIYLANAVVDADVVVTIGRIGFDPVLGHRGTNSVFYPGLSSAEAIGRAHGQGHSELEPDDVRPLRQMIDEIGWLLGTQFSIQVIPAAGGGVAQVLAGAGESVFRRGKELLSQQWIVELSERAGIVVAGIDDGEGTAGWNELGAALAAARSLVTRGGKIVALTNLQSEPGPGIEILQQSDNPRDALKPLRTQAPPDLIPATQLAQALDWADVYLMSGLESDLVEDLFMVPLAGPDEALRLVENGTETCAFLSGAQYAFGRIRPE
jgi:nickel-dependent lactate racemase